MSVERQPVTTQFPFGVEFQRSLLRVICENAGFASTVVEYLEPVYFENEVLVWTFAQILAYRQKYNAVPSLRVVKEMTRQLPTQAREFYERAIDLISTADLRGEDWLKDQTTDFIRRNIFTEAYRSSREFYNQGEVTKSYDVMMKAMDRIYNLDFGDADRSFFFEDFGQRQAERLSGDPMLDSFSTGFPEIDNVLYGGLSVGELGVWGARLKKGKSTLLLNFGAQAIRRTEANVLHLVYEGSRRLIENRYDTFFAQQSYYDVLSGNLSKEVLERVNFEYRMFAGRLVVRGFTREWEYTAETIDQELRELQQAKGWKPRLIVVDYGDLLRSRNKHHRTEVEHQGAAFQDLKTLANRGYAVWTATQGTRPTKEEDDEVMETIMRVRDFGWSQNKAKVADFLGTINRTQEEKERNTCRLFCEEYRSNAANVTVRIHADFDHMTMASMAACGEQVLPQSIGNNPTNQPEQMPMLPVQQRVPI